MEWIELNTCEHGRVFIKIDSIASVLEYDSFNAVSQKSESFAVKDSFCRIKYILEYKSVPPVDPDKVKGIIDEEGLIAAVKYVRDKNPKYTLLDSKNYVDRIKDLYA